MTVQNFEYKSFNFSVESAEEEKAIGDQRLGRVKGYIATYGNKDRGGDIIVQGAFTDCIARLKAENRPLRMKYEHSSMDLIGGFPADKMLETDKGLYVEGLIDLNVQRGREAYSLAKNGFLTDFSIGYSIDEFDFQDDARLLKKVSVWEASMVGEPLNAQAKITEVKTNRNFKDLTLAPNETSFNPIKALKRVKSFTKSEDSPSQDYKNAFLIHDDGNSKEFDSYKFLYADVVDDNMVAIPKAIKAISVAMKCNHMSFEGLEEGAKTRLKGHVSKYFGKMGMDDPFKGFGKSLSESLTVNDIEDLNSIDEVEYFLDLLGIEGKEFESRKCFDRSLREAGLSKSASNCLISRFNRGQLDDEEKQHSDYVEQVALKQITECLREINTFLLKNKNNR